jgi:hypothetical protein
MPKKLVSLFILLLLLLAACNEGPPLEEGQSSVFQVGDEWTYQTRPGEGLSTFIVTKIDQTTIDEQEQTIIHIMVTDLEMEHPDGGLVTAVPHLPFTETALNRSALQPFDIIDPLPEDALRTYENWRERYLRNDASVFEVTIAHALDDIQANLEANAQ